jgi:hypothetical protein
VAIILKDNGGSMRALPMPGFLRGGTVEQRNNWTETDFNWHMRQALQDQGYRAMHIRETDTPGTADLLVYKMYPQMTPESTLIVIEAWLELKIDNNVKKDIRPGQREFMRDHWNMGQNALFVMRDRKTELLVIRQGDLKGRIKQVSDNPYEVKWLEVFKAFKTR